MSRALPCTLAVLALALVGCGDNAEAPAPVRTLSPEPTATGTAAPPHPLCTALNPRIVGTAGAEGVSELSGLAPSPSGVLWAHNDSGDAPRVFALAPADGRVLREVAVTGAEAVDWEDMAARGRTLYVGDIGDNAGRRGEIAVYRFPEPSAPTVAATEIVLRYPDPPHDAEALLVDPRSGQLVIVTKDFGGASRVYTGRGGTLNLAAELSLGVGQAITAGDVSADGRTIVLRSYDRAFVWERRGGEPLARALQRPPCTAGANLLEEGQGETLALTRDGRAFYTVPEGADPPLRRYDR